MDDAARRALVARAAERLRACAELLREQGGGKGAVSIAGTPEELDELAALLEGAVASG